MTGTAQGVASADTTCRATRHGGEHRFEIAGGRGLLTPARFGIVFAFSDREGEGLVMIRKELKSRGKRIVIVAGLLCAFVAGAGLNSTDSATAPAEDWIRAQHEARVELDTSRVLDVVREHRRTATDVWRKTLADAIVAEALAEDLDPLFVAAIVARESSFKTRIVSHAGAVGLMQLRPWVARDMAMRSAVAWDGVQTLHDPQLNVRLGVRYYKELFDRFGDEQTALTAYCYGPSRVAQQLRRGTYDGSRYATEILALHLRLTGRDAA